ncbi:MAG: RNA polymerase sigma factor [Phycisphaerae bacterium]
MAEGQAEPFLIEAIQRGDPLAWRDVIDRYQGRLLHFARRMLAQPGDAEDLVQETFVGLLRSLNRYDRSRSLETYLFAILRHKLSDHFRSAGRAQRQSLEQLDFEEPSSRWVQTDTPSSRLADAESVAAQRATLVHCLRTYVEQCCDQGKFHDLMVIEMLVVLGLRNKEAAADLGVSETAIAGVKFRALERWREIAQSQSAAHDWQEADLSHDSTVARIWREEGVSCLKRSTLGRYVLGVLDDDWNAYIDFHVSKAGCPRCAANLDDLRSEEARDEAAHDRLREQCFASSVGFLSKTPGG